MSMKSLCGEPVSMWLPEKYKKPNTSTYVQGVEVETDYMGMVPEGFDTIRLPEAEYLMFQGQPFREEDYCEAIRTVQAAMDSYDPSIVGYRWDDENPRIQLEPRGGRGYIELRAVRRVSEMSEAIFVEGLTKTYNGKTVVDHLNLSVKSGTVFGLLGANGAGKSTTIECMLGTKQADSGTVRLLGKDPRKKRRTLFQRIGVQFQEGDYHKEIKVSELCEETASLYRSPADWRKLCEQFGIGDKANTRGQKSFGRRTPAAFYRSGADPTAGAGVSSTS